MIRIDITPAVTVTKTGTRKVKGQEVPHEWQAREYSAIATRDGIEIARVTMGETLSVIQPILQKVKDAGAEPGEEIIFYRGNTEVFVTMTLDHWLNPPKKERKKKNGSKGDTAPVGVLQLPPDAKPCGEGVYVREVDDAARHAGDNGGHGAGSGPTLPDLQSEDQQGGDLGGDQ